MIACFWQKINVRNDVLFWPVLIYLSFLWEYNFDQSFYWRLGQFLAPTSTVINHRVKDSSLMETQMFLQWCR